MTDADETEQRNTNSLGVAKQVAVLAKVALNSVQGDPDRSSQTAWSFVSREPAES